MARMVPGILVDSPGPAGSPGTYIFVGTGDPNSKTDFGAVPSTAPSFPSVNSLPPASINIGSLFLRLDGSTSTSLYVKTASPNVWTAK